MDGPKGVKPPSGVPLSKPEQLDKESLSGHEPDVCEEPISSSISLLVHVEAVGHVHVQVNNTWPVNLTRG